MDKILARTIYGEARGEFHLFGPASLMGIAWVVRNRNAAQTWYGKTIDEVCLKPLQFSCWNATDRNKAIIEAVTSDNTLFGLCDKIADWVLAADPFADVTMGSTNYHAKGILPSWTQGKTPTVFIGNHVFYKL